MRKTIDYIVIALKGAAMGAADVVPGVSGGTIAFISGIYEELLNSIKSIDGQALRLLVTLKLRRFWQKINGNFLFSLVAGVAVSIFSLAKLMTWLLGNYPILTWAFFFGLIVASTVMIGRTIPKWNVKIGVAALAGAIAAYWITTATPASTPDTWWFIILCGAIAVCAMILPGISGAFILLLLDKYQYMMEAVSNYRIGIILLFIAGAVIGLVSFSHLLSWFLKNYRFLTLAVLTGFLFGSLNKVWPWKISTSEYLDSHGVLQPLTQRNEWPDIYGKALDTDPQLLGACLCAVAGFLLITVVEYAGRRAGKNEPTTGS